MRFLISIAAASLLMCVTSTAQTFVAGEDEVSAREFALNVEKSPARYAGNYAFGFSEGESTLKLAVKGTSVSGELTYSLWDERTETFKSRTITFKGKIVGGMLIADKWYAVFVTRGEQKGIIFYDAPTDYAKGNFGYRVE